ncbi:Activin_recp domain-containing protein [Caenorhabditis elegans]|uniref:Activin_recp domain-containing protein n=1 Tax=Caenorhabditis elegans TaxID=6239 RepID=Q17927_CAEEL|nr:Activin_recp domain-containing protein [Caenorhabditis elegans]CCD64271.1 Activin_recp domain-containing protein [Caenorhabditis elegans]|eukprot:NP_504987.1 Uncharacterized protein CELE_C12D5.3 [Caenorhabditis elegans]
MFSTKTAIVLLAAIIASSDAIECYQQNVGTPKARIIDNMISCFSMYYSSERIASFGGISNNFKNAPRKQELALADGTCHRVEKTALDNTRSVHYADTVICYCNKPLCNMPNSIEDFENSGYKLTDQD